MIIIILSVIIIILLFLYNNNNKKQSDYDKIAFINKIDKERFIILTNSIKEFKKLIKLKTDRYYDYLHDIYTIILEICYSLHIENLKPKNTKRLNKLIKYFRVNYYNDILALKKYSKNPKLLTDYEVVPANYRAINNMLP
jgi:predicted nucleic acid-binding protein|tara:strand:+ start:540 stop:959 length:420 start_codon:yes stop_codon:yes gene_type:complete